MSADLHDQGDPLSRIADALERLAPARSGAIDWCAHPAYLWGREGPRSLDGIDALPLDRLKGMDRQKDAVLQNVQRHAAGYAAHDMLLWGARGTGKSALLLAAVSDVQMRTDGKIALIQLDPAALANLADLFDAVGAIDRRFIIMLDDLAFDAGDDRLQRQLRSALEGGLPARPANIRLATTSNHRVLRDRDEGDQPGPLHARDRLEDQLALSDRFGLRLGFHPASQAHFLEIVAAHADAAGLEWDEGDALEWSRHHGQLSGRSAYQYVTELAGRVGKSL